MRPVPPPLMMLTGMISVQFGAAFAVKLFTHVGPAGAVLLRLGMSAVIMLAITRPSLRGRSRSDLLAVLGYGLSLGAMNWSFYECLDRLALGVAVTLELLGPLLLATVGSRRRVDLLWVALAAGGVAMLCLIGDHKQVTAWGIFFALLAGAMWVCYILLAKRVGTSFAQLDGLAIASGIGALVVLPAGLVQGGSSLGHGSVLGAGLAIAILSSIVPYSLDMLTLRRISAATFGLLVSMAPAIAAVAGIVVLGQSLSALLVVAAVLVIAASIGCTMTSRSELPEAVPATAD